MKTFRNENVTSHLHSTTSALALIAAVTVLGMFLMFLLKGVGQDPLQYVRPVEDYAHYLTKNPGLLRFVIGLDNLFLILYSAMFLSLGCILWDSTPSKPILTAAIGILILVGFLDLAENMHFLVMISAALQQIAISSAQIEAQVWESLVKFHLSYLGLFLLGFSFPGMSALERAIRFALKWVQLPVGLLIYVTPPKVAFPLVMTRFSFFLLTLTAIWALFRREKSCSNERP